MTKLVDEVNERKKAEALVKLQKKFEHLGTTKKSKSGKTQSPRYVDAFGAEFFAKAAAQLKTFIESKSKNEDTRKKAEAKLATLKKGLFEEDGQGGVFDYVLLPKITQALEKYQNNETLDSDERAYFLAYAAYSYLDKLLDLSYDPLVKFIQEEKLEGIGATLKELEQASRGILRMAILSRSQKNRVLKSKIKSEMQK